MTVEVKEGLKSKVKAGGGQISYLVRGTLVAADAYAAFIAVAPTNFNGAPLSGYDGEELGEWELWEFTAQYSIPSPTQPDQESGNIYINHENTGGTVHINQSIATVGAYCVPCIKSRPSLWKFGSITPGSWSIIEAGFTESGCTEVAPNPTSPAPVNGVTTAYGTFTGPAGVAPWTGGAINITRDGINGVDIPAANKKFTITLYVDTLTKLQIKQLDDIAQHVNAFPILNWPCPDYAAGEVRFESWTQNNQGRENIELRFNFVREPNLTGLTIGSITGISKRGHEYLWVYYQEHEDTISHVIIKRPIYAYVEQVFYYSDFNIIKQLIAASFYTQNPTP